ncbi:heterogeneous nuclear ribonucleoprotein 1-like [Aristolochia californica]|uniref:heterogeneous nuclear ribonucleoprotein 1-like n=1 Tax=Aristolochia californica TaxID=171875 RepID=UPI0035DCDB9D
MDSDQGKLFIGGISWDTSEDKLKEYFGKYGEVLQTVIMRDKNTGRPRGFGFVVFADPAILDRVLQDKHTIDGRMVEAKRALSREEQHTSSRSGSNSNAGRNYSGAGNIKTKKIFVGGLPPTLSEEGFREYFENYGHVTDVVVMYDQTTQRPRGFGFISFDTEDAVDRVLHKTFHELNGKLVEVKRALPKDANPGSAARSGGAYSGYGGSGVNTNSYDGRMDGNRYMQPQAAGGGYPTYGSSGYGAPGYGYGTAGNGVGYSYGVGGYGGANAGYSGPPGAYGNPNAPSAGYVGGPPGAPRSPWNTQAPSSYGSAGYGAGAGYGAAAAWGGSAGGGGAGSAPAGQSPSGVAGYGYGGYGGNEGAYGNQTGYGPVGGRGSSVPSSNSGGAGGEQQGGGAAYMSGGYGDANGNTGYTNAVWRSDASQGAGYGATQGNGLSSGQVGYGSGYGGPHSRQAQQQ